MSVPPKQAAEILAFISQSLGWPVTHAVEGGGVELQLRCVLSAHTVPPGVQRRAAELIANLYRQAVEEALVEAVTGEQLRRALEVRGWTAQELADRSAATAATIRKYLANTSRPREDTARRVHNALLGRALDDPVSWMDLAGTKRTSPQ